MAHVLTNLGNISKNRGDYARATALHEESLTLRRDLDDKRGIATSLTNLGNIAIRQGAYARATTQYEESLALSRDIADTRGIAFGLQSLGDIADLHGEYSRATALYEECLALFRSLGDTNAIATALRQLGDVAYHQGEYARATAWCEESLALQRGIGDTRGIANSLHALGKVALTGDVGRARTYFVESICLYQMLDAKPDIAECLDDLASVASALAQPTCAARLFGAAASLRASIGTPAAPMEDVLHERTVASTRAALGAEAFATAFTAGRVLVVGQAITEACEEMG